MRTLFEYYKVVLNEVEDTKQFSSHLLLLKEVDSNKIINLYINSYSANEIEIMDDTNFCEFSEFTDSIFKVFDKELTKIVLYRKDSSSEELIFEAFISGKKIRISNTQAIILSIQFSIPIEMTKDVANDYTYIEKATKKEVKIEDRIKKMTTEDLIICKEEALHNEDYKTAALARDEINLRKET